MNNTDGSEVVRLTADDARAVRALFREVTSALRRQGNGQWDRWYPNRFVLAGDLKRGRMYGIRENGAVVAAVAVAPGPGRSGGKPWSSPDATAASIRRLTVHPAHQGRGLGRKLLQFAEEQAGRSGAASIRLDVYAGNPLAAGMYLRAGYRDVGETRYPMRRLPYRHMEKLI